MNPMEVMNLGKVNSKRYDIYKVHASQLTSKVIEAYKEGQKMPHFIEYASQQKAKFEQAVLENTQAIMQLIQKGNENVTQ